MSGYLEVKYPFKSSLGLNPFKSWKRQWCILRPSATFSGGVLAVYCSEAGAAAGTVELPSGFVVRRAKSRSRPYAFAVFPSDEPRKPRVLLAAATLHDAQQWMDKIKLLICESKLIECEGSIKDSYSVTITSTDLSRKCGLSGVDCAVSVTSNGVVISHTQRPILLHWKHINEASLSTDSRNGTCIITVNSGFIHGGGVLQLTSPLAEPLARALRSTLAGRSPASRALSKSDGDLNNKSVDELQGGRRSWQGGPAEVSADDLELVMAEHRAGALPRCAHLALDDSMSDRRSLLSIASGIYEEIAEEPSEPEHGVYCKMNRDRPLGALKLCSVAASIRLEEPTYESVAECVFATLRRPRRPPPLPPRVHTPVVGAPCGVPRAGSLGCLPGRSASAAGRSAPAPGDCAPNNSKTLPRWDRSRHAFSAFRKRLKSDSRTVTSPKSETKDKDVESKKKKFDFTPTRDIFKSFKVSRKMKNLKLGGALAKGETKSCEFLDENEHVKADRCSKSVESLDYDNFDGDLSIEFDDRTVASLSISQDIVDLIIKEHEKLNQLCAKEPEGEYMPMSPIVPPLEHHYIVMSPRTNMA